MEPEPPLTQQPQNIARIDSPLDRRRLSEMPVDRFAGLTFREYKDAIEFSKAVSHARHGLPAFLKGNPADCLIITTQALRWKLEPVWVMQNSYVAKSEGIINYENFVFAAILMASNVLKRRPRYIYSGENEERSCTVSAVFVGEELAHEYTTPPLRICRPAKNERGEIKGSPLWIRDVDQQLAYFAIRNFARRYIPELLGGVYSRDEFDDSTKEAVDVTPSSPNLMQRLPEKMASVAGFQTDVVDNGIAAEAAAKEAEAKAEKKARKATEKAQDEPKASEGVAAPEASKPAPEPPCPPTTAEQYVDYASKWIGGATDPNKLEVRWLGEREMRQKLSVKIAQRKRLDGMVVSRAAELRYKSKPKT
jgi:hypothetical protein